MSVQRKHEASSTRYVCGAVATDEDVPVWTTLLAGWELNQARRTTRKAVASSSCITLVS